MVASTSDFVVKPCSTAFGSCGCVFGSCAFGCCGAELDVSGDALAKEEKNIVNNTNIFKPGGGIALLVNSGSLRNQPTWG